MQIEGNTVGDKVVEGKTKIVYRLADNPDKVLLHSKDRITAGDGERAHDLKGKAEISTTTASAIFEMLNNAGIKSHFIKRSGQTCMVCNYCDMVPLEFVTRRIATGSFLKRNPGVKEGYRFCPPKQEIFFKDDANHDPQWSYEQCVEAKLEFGGRLIGRDEIDIMCKSTVTVFEVLEKAWASLDCSLIDMKIEFGVNPKTGEILLADIIDSDSWRLWPAGDRRLMKDKQVYRELREVTSEALDTVKRNFEWVADRVGQLSPKPSGRAVVFMGSPTDMAHCEKIRAACKLYGVPCELRVSSAHKGTDETKNILAQSNGLGPVLSGNAAWPVINCPPISADWVTSPDGAALAAAQILCLNDHMIWAKLRTKQLNTWVGLKEADIKARKTNFMIEKSEVFQNGH
ncbi:PUR6-like protein [Mya arenaria]|uniref:PUR6-like protein n=1 Tax=Mya arenaria TaxID=6604 RepID=A0ABY7DMQ6_MYAAR|nr:PUR6-like protein [Mya arenaria]